MQRAVAANPTDAHAVYGLGLILASCQRSEEAVSWLRHAITLKPNYAEAYYALGNALRELGDVGTALTMLRRATELAPRNAEFHAQLGDVLRVQVGSDAAQPSYRRAAAAARGTTLGRVCHAKQLVAEEKIAEAAEILRRALALDPNNVGAISMAGQVLSYSGQLTAAAEHFSRALTLAPDQPWEAWCGLAAIRKFTNADQPLVSNIEAKLAKARVPVSSRMRVHFAIGKALDDLGQYEAAMRHFDSANRLRRSLKPFDRRQVLAAVDSLIECFTDRFFADRQEIGVPDETPVFVLGMPRSGTTLTEQLLSCHPGIAAAGEAPFWPNRSQTMDRAAVEAMDAGGARAIAADYGAALRHRAGDAARIVDKMPFNFMWIGLIRLIFPRAAIIHCRRDPIDTCLSIYVTDFDSNWGFVSDREDLVFYYRQYLRLMEHWRTVLPRDRFAEIDYERLTGDPASEMRRLIAFCGVEWDDACLRPESNDRTIRTASLWQARQPIYRSSVARWRNYEPWLGPLGTLR